MEFQREFIEIGSVQVRYYGIIIVTAMLVATFIAAYLARRSGRDPEHIYGALTWAIIPGIIFARAWFVFFPPAALCAEGAAICKDTQWFLDNFFDTQEGAIAIWSGGLSIFGALLGGGLGAWLYFSPLHGPVARFFSLIFLPVTFVFDLIGKAINAVLSRLGMDVSSEAQPIPEFPKKGMLILPWLDIAGVVLPLAQSIGRWANYVNQELFGKPSDLPWAIRIPRDIAAEVGYGGIQYARIIDGETVYTFHPLFLYESLWNFAAFLILYWLYTNRRNSFRLGDFFLIYVAQYSFIRFLLEFLRVEVTLVGDTNLSQVVTAVGFIVAIALLVMRHRPGASTVPYDEAIPPEDLIQPEPAT